MRRVLQIALVFAMVSPWALAEEKGQEPERRQSVAAPGSKEEKETQAQGELVEALENELKSLPALDGFEARMAELRAMCRQLREQSERGVPNR